MMFRINIYLTIIFLIFIGISFYITNVISNKTLKYATKRQEVIGDLTIGIFQAFFKYMGQVVEPLTEASYMIISMQSAIASAERIYELLDEKEIIKNL